MRRCLEPVDVMVLIGLCATAAAAHLFFAVSNGTLQAGVSHPEGVGISTSILESMKWVQPALGQAIVQDAVLEREASRKIIDSAMQLNRAIIAGELADASSSVWLERLRAQATRAQAEHAARVQFVLGRSIVEFTKRGVRIGALPTDQTTSDYNRRMIDLVQATRARMEAKFHETHQPSLGNDIVLGSQQLDRLRVQIQQRLGHAIVAVTTVQHRYHTELEALQEQIGALAVAAATTELRAELFDRLAAAAYPRTDMPRFAGPRSWPDVPFGILLAATGVLIGIFLIGLRLTAGGPEEDMAGEGPKEKGEAGRHVRDVRLEQMREDYRKSA
jgi:hypothetical protein